MAKELGALTVAIVTKPFFYEGKKRQVNAEEGIKELKEQVDTLIVIPNDRIMLVVEKGTPLLKSFAIANDVLRQAVQGISDLILTTGLINLDFADVKTVMENAGRAVMGVGIADGENGAAMAAKKAIQNPLLEDSNIDGARGILINITGGMELSLHDVQEATQLIYESAHKEANIIFGAVIDPDLTDEVRVTVIATGFEPKKEKVVVTEEVKKFKPKSISVPPRNKRLSSTERVLAKSIKTPVAELPSELLNYDEPYDLPTFMRNQGRG